MATKTIGNNVYNTVALDGTSYASPLTITATGSIAPGPGDVGVFEPGTYANRIVVNRGSVTGGGGAAGPDLNALGTAGAGGTGGNGVELDGGGTIVNSGGISDADGGQGGGNYFLLGNYVAGRELHRLRQPFTCSPMAANTPRSIPAMSGRPGHSAYHGSNGTTRH